MCAVVARLLWLRRNTVIHRREMEHPITVISHARAQVHNFDSTMAVTPKHRRSMDVLESRWCKPPEGIVKLNWDASLDTKTAKMGFGVVAQDHLGRVVAASCDVRSYLTEPEGAEILAMRNVVDLCLHLGLEHVCLEGDAWSVVQSLQQEEQRGGRFGHVVQDVAETLRELQEWRVQHVPREANKVAHCLARRALSLTRRNRSG